MRVQSGPLLAACALLVSSLLEAPLAWALGLGEARVESYMQQPLDARVRLISRSEAELATVTASLASAEDFRIIGLDRTALSVPLTFEVIADLDDPHIRVRSQLPINEPVVQLVVEVVWASGRMLRQYTLFLDPPTIDAAAPLPGVSKAKPVERPPALTTPPERPSVTETTAQSEAEPVTGDAETEPPPQQPQRIVTPLQASGEAGEYGPVQRGQTLWGIANRISRERGYSVNQLMLAIQQQNPGAFNQGNINSLKAGAVLRLPSRDEVLSFSQDEAMLEVQRQELVWRSGSGSVPAGVDELPVIADLEPVDTVGPAEESTDIDVIAEPGTADEIARGRLELVPPANDDALAADAGIGNTGDENEEGAVSVVEELARTQEELVNAQQENEYLADRIQELEAELARREPDEQDAGLVEDTGLAELEQRLQEQRQAGEEEEVQVIPQDEQRPWLARWTPWVLITLLLAVGAVVWWLRSRRSEDEVVHGITEDAEDILRVLRDEGDVPVGDISTRDNAVEPARVTAPRPPHTDEEAVELDADDPETQLDLARAYLSMGDQQAARTILVGVIESGDAEQVAEARRMMQEV